MKIYSSSGKSVLFSQQNLDFKHSLETEMSLEEEENKRFKDWDVQTDWLIETPENILYQRSRRV